MGVLFTFHPKLTSQTITSVSKVKTSNSETSNDKVEMPKIKTVRMSEPIIEEWESDSDDDEKEKGFTGKMIVGVVVVTVVCFDIEEN
ncbi:hypothetical protein Tco_0264317 [Tanacetum coccineum]